MWRLRRNSCPAPATQFIQAEPQPVLSMVEGAQDRPVERRPTGIDTANGFTDKNGLWTYCTTFVPRSPRTV
jgi:hypothetical protein